MVARVEALIAGWGLDEALKRAEAYIAAGISLLTMILRFIPLSLIHIWVHIVILVKLNFFSGADAILMHSKRSDSSEIEAFMKIWKNQV